MRSLSSSLSATPAAISAILPGEWKSSASANGTRSRAASNRAVVVLRVPDTPVTTTQGGTMRLGVCAGTGDHPL
ncbi:hypothetical protein [Nocardia africana]|uniref:Uncharacterized protein n=1 Tax=Nocardia africana TaxID=134964 RepID=A0A378X141_9NOCA|nr:hypothetical protein [Nocardia africana]MCC3311581.1 hypothetical protein [Nocardia africana]SUA47158.1 Uncharacterised protein [Nocardia africana]